MTRIAVVADTFPAISETFIAAEVQALRRLGATVDVFAHTRAAQADPDVEIEAAYLVEQRRAMAAVWPLGALRDVRAQRRWREQEQPLTLRELAPLIAGVKGADHIHAHFGAGAALSAMRAGRLTGTPYSVTLHGYDIFLTRMNLAEKLARAKFATSGSDYTVGEIRRMYPSADVHRIVMGVDADLWRRTSPRRDPRLVVAVGRLVEKKGFIHLIRAAEHLPAGMRVVIAGDGPLRDELAAAAGDRVQLLGALPSRKVRELVELAAVVAIPAVIAASGDRDSMPVIAKEALALEVPVVASDVCGLPEVVREPWGVLVPPGDPVALAEGIVAAAGRNAAAGRAHVIRHCNVDAEARRLLALISQ